MSSEPDQTIDAGLEEAVPVEIPPPPAAVRPLRVWPVFAIYLGAVVLCTAAQIPVVAAMAIFVIARGGRPRTY